MLYSPHEKGKLIQYTGTKMLRFLLGRGGSDEAAQLHLYRLLPDFLESQSLSQHESKYLTMVNSGVP